MENEESRRYVTKTPEFFVPIFREKPDGSIKQGSGADITILRSLECYVRSDDGRKRHIERLSEDFYGGDSLVNFFKRQYDQVSLITDTQDSLQTRYRNLVEASIALYDSFIEVGVAPEQARFVLPQGVYTQWIWTGSLAAYARFYKQRTDPHAQKEIQDLARMVGEIIQPLFPVAWEVLTKGAGSEV